MGNVHYVMIRVDFLVSEQTNEIFYFLSFVAVSQYTTQTTTLLKTLNNQILTSKKQIKLEVQTTMDARNAHAILDNAVTLVSQPTSPSFIHISINMKKTKQE